MEASSITRGTRPRCLDGRQLRSRGGGGNVNTNAMEASKACGRESLPRKVFLVHSDDDGLDGAHSEVSKGCTAPSHKDTDRLKED